VYEVTFCVCPCSCSGFLWCVAAISRAVALRQSTSDFAEQLESGVENFELIAVCTCEGRYESVCAGITMQRQRLMHF